jgi:HSP20 family protein
MELKLWSPFSDLEGGWRFDFPRLFSEMSSTFRPTVDVVKTDDGLTITAEVPGMSPEDIQIMLDGRLLTLKGEKTEEKEVSEEDRFLRERSYGSFVRTIPLPEGVSADKIDAMYDKGVLTVHVVLPEAKTIEPRTIEVKTT